MFFFNFIFHNYGKNFFHRPFMEYTFLECKQNVVAGIDTLMSIFDGLEPSIFCRKMEKARPMREEMDGKNVYFPAKVGIFNFDVIIHKVLFPIFSLTWRVNNYISRQEML